MDVRKWQSVPPPRAPVAAAAPARRSSSATDSLGRCARSGIWIAPNAEAFLLADQERAWRVCLLAARAGRKNLMDRRAAILSAQHTSLDFHGRPRGALSLR